MSKTRPQPQKLTTTSRYRRRVLDARIVSNRPNVSIDGGPHTDKPAPGLECSSQHFAIGRARQIGDEVNGARALVTCQVLGGKGDDLRFAG